MNTEIDLDKLNGKKWKAVLNIFYISSPGQYGGDFRIDSHPIARKLKITGQELNQCIMFLKEHQIIDYASSDKNAYTITKKGFDIALENEKNNSNLIFQKASIGLSAILVISTTFNFLYQTGKYTPDEIIFFFTVFIFLIYITIQYDFIKNIKKFMGFS